ncbi:MAG: hypothetical protein RR483_00745 [Clostridia bacterium]
MFSIIFSIIFSGCSIEKDEVSHLITRSFIQSIAEKYNKYSYNYEFTETEGILIDGAISYFIANSNDFKDIIKKQITDYTESKIIYPKESFDNTLGTVFNLNKNDFSSMYLNLNNNCYTVPNLEGVKTEHKTVVDTIKKIGIEKYSFNTIVSAISTQTGDYETTLKQTFVIETDGHSFKFISVKIDWVLPGFYVVKF